MTSTDELLPCPFCGGEAVLWHNKTWDYEVRCTKCRVKTRQHHENEVGAVMDWNKRHVDTCKIECCFGEVMPEHNAQLQHCIACNDWFVIFAEDEDGDTWDITPNYCPGCGAKVVN